LVDQRALETAATSTSAVGRFATAMSLKTAERRMQVETSDYRLKERLRLSVSRIECLQVG
jgi:hypothetical protein